MSDSRKIRRALLSVYDKTGLVEFARALHDEFNIELISTGGTAKVLKDAGLPVTLVEEITGFPEMLDGRVKTLHPKIHAAILADRDNPEHMRHLAEHGIEPIDMVVVNLYPFEQTIAKPDCTFEEAIEMIDIGGPCLLRAAAKNHRHVLVVRNPRDYGALLRVLHHEPDIISAEEWRQREAFSVFGETEEYDAAIWQWLGGNTDDGAPTFFVRRFFAEALLRYGENPHQVGKLINIYEAVDRTNLLRSTVRRAGEYEHEVQASFSFNNFVDASAAVQLCAELTWASQKLWHRRPAGVATGETPVPQPPRWRPIEGEHLTRRNLPHIQNPGRTYFITFRVRSGELPPAARDIVLQSCHFWHGQRMSLHMATVMPDHVHLLLTPYLLPSGASIALSDLLHSIKSYTAHKIGQLLQSRGPVWMDESFDRVMRDEQEFYEKREYIETNAERAGLGSDYRWVWASETEFEEGGCVGETSDPHRRDAGVTDLPAAHRRDAGATHTLPAASFIKHTNACGAAVHADPLEVYRRAYLGDPNAAMGGVLAVNFNVDATFAEAVMETYARWGKAAGAGGYFLEVWLAPSFADDAVQVIRTKKDWGQRVRLLAVGDLNAPPDPNEMDFKRIAGGMLMQTRDLVGLNEDQWKVVTQRSPTESELDDLRLAWLVCKHTKSNAITICRDGMLIGNGAGQMSRVMSCRIATWLAQENGHAEALKGAVAASDAFFPFRDGPDLLIDAGVTALIQPGGSKRDAEVIEACNARGVAMIFTGTRHFKH